MRGKVQRQRMHARARRITPAYAGKRVRCSQQALPRTDHPRMCGEKSKTKDTAAYTPGSPPHVRGKGSTNGGSSWSQRITPACAGKRVEFYAERHKDQDHPRMCGEKTDAQYQLPIMQGSPPHVRGKVGLRLIAAQDDGITPACAGKSEPPGSGLGASGDHPRMCGEKTKPQRVAPPKLGSPPHVRGKVSQFVDGCACHGITPACAGKRGFRSNQPVYPRDHPRMCGEKLMFCQKSTPS